MGKAAEVLSVAADVLVVFWTLIAFVIAWRVAGVWKGIKGKSREWAKRLANIASEFVS
jgi:hypothetical protein